MCDKQMYRKDNPEPRTSEELWEKSAMNPKNRKEDKGAPNKA